MAADVSGVGSRKLLYSAQPPYTIAGLYNTAVVASRVNSRLLSRAQDLPPASLSLAPLYSLYTRSLPGAIEGRVNC